MFGIRSSFVTTTNYDYRHLLSFSLSASLITYPYLTGPDVASNPVEDVVAPLPVIALDEPFPWSEDSEYARNLSKAKVNLLCIAYYFEDFLRCAALRPAGARSSSSPFVFERQTSFAVYGEAKPPCLIPFMTM